MIRYWMKNDALVKKEFMVNYRKLFFKNCYATFVATCFLESRILWYVNSFLQQELWYPKVLEHPTTIFY